MQELFLHDLTERFLVSLPLGKFDFPSRILGVFICFSSHFSSRVANLVFSPPLVLRSEEILTYIIIDWLNPNYTSCLLACFINFIAIIFLFFCVCIEDTSLFAEFLVTSCKTLEISVRPATLTKMYKSSAVRELLWRSLRLPTVKF